MVIESRYRHPSVGDTLFVASSYVKAMSKAVRPTKNAKAGATLDLFSGFIELHVLHHASEQPVYGLWLIEELAEHGYRVSPGTLYPLLHSLEQSEMMKSYNEVSAGKIRRYYRITVKGRRFLRKAKVQLAELVAEIFEGENLESYLNDGKRLK
jgi:PadR family transcriptional regulator, regulatory protein PadR